VLLPLSVTVGLVAAACGGGGGSKPSPSAGGTTTSQVEETTTTLAGQVADTTTTLSSGSTTTAAAALKTGTSVKKVSSPTTAKQTKQTLPAGINNIVSNPTTTAPPANVQVGGTFTYLNASDPTSIDSALATTTVPTDGPIATALYDTLVYFNSGDGAITPQIATSLTSPDGIVWTLKIRPDIVFSDGTPYDAAAIKFNWQRLVDPATKASRALYLPPSTLDVLDPTTLRITLKARNGAFPNSVVYIGYIGSPTAIMKNPDQFASNPVGAGAFMFKSWVRGSQMTLVRNPHYWNAPLPYLDQLIIKPIVDESQRVNTLNTGAAQMLWSRVPSSQKAASSAGATPNLLVTNGGTNAYFNTTTAPFKDPRAREAVVRAIDRDQYNKVINDGATPSLHSIFSEQSPFYDASLTQYSYDPVRAQQLFDAVAADTGGPVTFEISGFAVQTQQTQAEYMQGLLRNFRNVKVTVQTYVIAAGTAKLANRDFQMMLAGGYFIDPEPNFTSLYVCSATPSYTGWCDPRFDALVNSQRSTLDPNQRVADLKEAQKIFYAAAPAIYYDRGYAWMMASPQVQNFDWINGGFPLFDRIWLKTH
jgi:peptide/nickel transport system substrate-binding protein